MAITMVNPISEFPRSHDNLLMQSQLAYAIIMIQGNEPPALSFFRNKSDSSLSPNPTPICQDSHISLTDTLRHVQLQLRKGDGKRYLEAVPGG